MTIETKKVATANEAIAISKEAQDVAIEAETELAEDSRYDYLDDLDELVDEPESVIETHAYLYGAKATFAHNTMKAALEYATEKVSNNGKVAVEVGRYNFKTHTFELIQTITAETLIEEATIDDYAVTTEAQEIAMDAELTNAQPTTDDDTDNDDNNGDNDDNDYEETDEPEILNADLFVNLYQSPMQEKYSSVTYTINGEQLHFFHHRLTHISAPALNLEGYFTKGRMSFWYGDKRIARDKVWQVPIIKETAKAQTEAFRKFFAGDHTPKFFKVSVYATFADGQDHDYAKYFDYFNQAQTFVEEAKTFIGDVPSQIYITNSGNYFFIRVNSTENYTLPAVDAAEAQNRIDDLKQAIADNESFTCDELTASLLRIANYHNKQTIVYYEAALRMTEPDKIMAAPVDKFEVGETYVGKISTGFTQPCDGIITVTKITKVYVFYTTKFKGRELKWNLKRRTNDKTEYIKDEFGTFIKATDKIKKPALNTPTNSPLDKPTVADDETKNEPEKQTVLKTKMTATELQKAFSDGKLPTDLTNEIRTALREASEAKRARIKARRKDLHGVRCRLTAVEVTAIFAKFLATDDTPEKNNISDSLTRAMKIALENIQENCRNKNLKAAQAEMQLYNICSNAMRELRMRLLNECEHQRLVAV